MPVSRRVFFKTGSSSGSSTEDASPVSGSSAGGASSAEVSSVGASSSISGSSSASPMDTLTGQAYKKIGFGKCNMEKVEIKLAACIEEVLEILAIRRTVFIEEQDVSEERERDGKDKEATHFLVKFSGKAV